MTETVSRPVAIGGHLTPATVLAGYQDGVYPMPAANADDIAINRLLYAEAVEDGAIEIRPTSLADPFELTWWSPDPRPVYSVGAGHRSRRLAQSLRGGRFAWHTTVDTEFARVVAECRLDRRPRWITDGLRDCLVALHESGYAHSVEVWQDDELIGGVFGIGSGTVFSADSCFHRVPNASRVALFDLEHRLAATDIGYIDLEWDSDSNRYLGARPMPSREFLPILRAGSAAVRLPTEPADVRRLGGPPPAR